MKKWRWWRCPDSMGFFPQEKIGTLCLTDLEVGEDMHKLASHVVDSVSWNPCFFWLFLGGRPFSSKFFCRGGDLRSHPYRPQKWPPGSKNDGVFLGKWHLLLSTGADFQVAPRSFLGGHFLEWFFVVGEDWLEDFWKGVEAEITTLVIYWDLLKSWSAVGKYMSLCYVTCFPVLCLAGPKLFIFLWGVVLLHALWKAWRLFEWTGNSCRFFGPEEDI